MSKPNIDTLLAEFNTKLLSVEHGVPSCSHEELAQSLLSILYEISANYDTYFKYIPRVLGILDRCPETAFTILIWLYFHLYEKVIHHKSIQKTDLTIFSSQENSLDIMKRVFEGTFLKGQQIRISTTQTNTENIPENDIKALIGVIEEAIDHYLKNLELTKDIIETMLMQISVLRNLLTIFADYHTFYVVSANIVKTLNISQHPQIARDLVEELILSSYIDNKAYYGYYNAFVSYSTNKAAIQGLTYACLSFLSALNSKTIDTIYIKQSIEEGLRFFRNIQQYAYVQKIYESVPSYIKFSDYQKRAFDHTYFTSLLMQHDLNLPSLILDYLNKHREQILNQGIHDALPWLLTLYNIKRLYYDADFSQTGLGYYISTFEYIVPEENYSTQKTILFGKVNELKEVLKVSLIKLDETRYIDDVSHDNDIPITIANRIISKSSTETDFEAIILSALVKSDFSIVFSQKERHGVAPVFVHKTDTDTFNAIYGDISTTISKIQLTNSFTFLWLLHAESQSYQLKFENNFSYQKLQTWDNKAFRNLISSSFFSTLAFDTTIKTKYEVRDILPEEYIDESNKIKNNFLFFKVDIAHSQKKLLVVMDMNLAGFPHNLLINNNEEFIYPQTPICNIVSTEWYLKNGNKIQLNTNYTKSIWIPTDCGDYTINMLFSKIEGCLKEHCFSIEQTEEPNTPISSELNIVVSHGSNNIATKPALYPDEHPRINFSTYIGEGKVLIFFVCHSGSTHTAPFSNSISSIAKRFLMNGYTSFIAPFWSMHVDIAPIWLPVFLDAINKETPIIDAVFNANMAVYKKFPTVAAWGCMHLYGDPHITISK